MEDSDTQLQSRRRARQANKRQFNYTLVIPTLLFPLLEHLIDWWLTRCSMLHGRNAYLRCAHAANQHALRLCSVTNGSKTAGKRDGHAIRALTGQTARISYINQAFSL